MILSVKNLSHGFGDRAIFNDVSFRLLKGEHIGLVGANGEGKSTFMNTITGKLPVNTDGGLKAMGHPVGASGIRMVYESWLQFHGKAGKRQLKDPKLGMAHCLGGKPWNNVSSVTIVGKELG